MEPKKESYTLEEVCCVLGLEKSRVRFVEREFGGFFGFSKRSHLPSLYSPKQLTIIEKINRLLDRPDLTVSKIKSGFLHLSQERGKGVFVIAVASGKGGVGKTSLSVNLAVLLARHGVRTVLFDADLGLANDHVFLGLNPRKTVVDLLQGTSSIEEILQEGPSGMKLIPGASGVFQLAELDDRQRDVLIEEMVRLRKMTDLLVVDAAAGISSNVLRFLGLADEVIVMTTPNIAATLDAFGLLRVAAQQRVEGNLNLVVNRVRNRAEAEQVHAKVARCSDQFLGKEVENIGCLFEDSAMEQSIQHRTPLVHYAPDAPAALCLEEIVEKLLEKRTQWKGGRRSRLYDLFMPLAV